MNNDTSERVTRRKLLGTLGATGIASLSGCVGILGVEYPLDIIEKDDVFREFAYDGPGFFELTTLGELQVRFDEEMEPTPDSWALLVDGQQRRAGPIAMEENTFETRVSPNQTFRVILAKGSELMENGFTYRLRGGDLLAEATLKISKGGT